MAIIKYGALVSEIKGKIGSTVFQRCGKMFAIRSQTSKNYGKYPSNYISRINFSAIAVAWQALTPANKASFTTYASTYPTYDKFGNPCVLSGYNLFVYLNRVWQLLGLSLLTACNAYAIVGLPSINWGYLNLHYNTWAVNVVSPFGTYTTLMLYVVAPLPYGSTQGKAHRIYAGSFKPPGTGVYDIGAQVFAVIKQKPVVTNYLHLSVRAVNTYTKQFTDYTIGYIYFDYV
jgi:hypothetical protein